MPVPAFSLKHGGKTMERKSLLILCVALLFAFPAQAQVQSSCGWSPETLGTGLQINTLAAFDDGTGPALYAGTSFQPTGMKRAWGVKWDGTSWTPLGNGLASHIFCMAVFDDGTGPALYAGGDFVSEGNIPLSAPWNFMPGPILTGIARWNGTSWSPVGTGLYRPPSGAIFPPAPGSTFPAIVTSLTVFDDGTGPALYAAGGITVSGAGVALPGHMAKWDGNAWSPVPAAMGGAINTVTSPFRILGAFDTGSGPALYGAGAYLPGVIRKWDGSAWVPLGAGVSGLAGTSFLPRIRALAVFDDGSGPALYAGGAFDMAGGVAANGIAKWDGASWSALGNGLGFGQNTNLHVDGIWSLAVHDDGTGPALMAGGYFSVAGNNIIKWDGTSWSDMNGGLNGIIGSLAVFDDGTGAALYAGAYGDLSVAMTVANGGVPPTTGTAIGNLHNVAKWSCTSNLGLALYTPTDGVGSGGVFVNNFNMIPGREYYNIFSLDLCAGGVGTGPYGGLCFNPGNVQFLVNQLLLPLGTLPFHFTASAQSATSGPYSLPPLTLEGICFEVHAGGLGAISPAIRFTIQ